MAKIWHIQIRSVLRGSILLCCIVSMLSLNAQNSVVGYWASNENGYKWVVEFAADGRFVADKNKISNDYHLYEYLPKDHKMCLGKSKWVWENGQAIKAMRYDTLQVTWLGIDEFKLQLWTSGETVTCKRLSAEAYQKHSRDRNIHRAAYDRRVRQYMENTGASYEVSADRLWRTAKDECDSLEVILREDGDMAAFVSGEDRTILGQFQNTYAAGVAFIENDTDTRQFLLTYYESLRIALTMLWQKAQSKVNNICLGEPPVAGIAEVDSARAARTIPNDSLIIETRGGGSYIHARGQSDFKFTHIEEKNADFKFNLSPSDEVVEVKGARRFYVFCKRLQFNEEDIQPQDVIHDIMLHEAIADFKVVDDSEGHFGFALGLNEGYELRFVSPETITIVKK